MRLGLLELFHDLELGVLQRADPPVERVQLVLHALEVLGVGDQPLVHAVAVARTANLDLLHVRVGLLLLDRQVVDHDACVAQTVVDVTATGLQLGDADDLGQRRALVAQEIGTGVELLHGEELLLGGRVGLQDVELLGWGNIGWRAIRRGTATDRCSAC